MDDYCCCKGHMTFEMSTTGMKLCAAYVAQLIREGVTFTIRNDKVSTEVTLTGGF